MYSPSYLSSSSLRSLRPLREKIEHIQYTRLSCQKFFPESAIIDRSTLKTSLDKLAGDYDEHYLDSDPVGIVHRYSSPDDIEAAGFVVSALSYGNAAQIRNSANAVLERTGASPSHFARSLTPQKAIETFRGFKHRWTTGNDIAFLFHVLGKVFNEESSLGALVKKLDNPEEKNIEGLLTRFSEWITAEYSGVFHGNSDRKNISYLIPSPSNGSACKRLAMFFRWMVRGPDGIDFGLWRFIDPGRLVIPVDSHIARMAGMLGLSARRTPDWKMALEITESLRQLDSDDLLQYDFALVRPGIVGACTKTKNGECPECFLHGVCRGTKSE